MKNLEEWFFSAAFVLVLIFLAFYMITPDKDSFGNWVSFAERIQILLKN